MIAELILAPEAEQDSFDAFAWYEEQRVGLGEPSSHWSEDRAKPTLSTGTVRAKGIAIFPFQSGFPNPGSWT